MARLAGEHWFRPSWWPYFDGGIPFEHTYAPLVPALTALYSKLGACSVARAFNGITGLVYVLGPLAMFAMACVFTRCAGYSFWAVLIYSLTSTARAVIPDPKWNPALFWTSRRLYTMIVWDDTPMATALTFVPLAVLFLWLALTRRKSIYHVLAGVCCVLAVSASVFGATTLVLCSACLLIAMPRQHLLSNSLRLAAIGIASYFVVCPFLPPSVLATIRGNQQKFPDDQWSLASLTALSAVLLGLAIFSHLLVRWRADWTVRFFGSLAFLAASIPITDAYFGRHFVPQPPRYQPLMEMAVALFIVFALRPLLEKMPRAVKAALAMLILSLAAEQLTSLRHFEKEITRPVAQNDLIEHKVATWVDQNMGSRRVMVPGSIAQWFNVWSNTPQLAGGAYTTTPNWSQQDAMSGICGGTSAKETEYSMQWLKAYGIHAIAVGGPASKEFWHSFANPKKFDGVLPVLWNEDDVTIYKVPQRSDSLARVIPQGAVTTRGAEGIMPMDDLSRYVAALDDQSLPLADFRWLDLRHASIRATLGSQQVISVQTNYHKGWHARANGQSLPVRKDGLGFILLQPACVGSCEIELTYDGGWEFILCRLLSYLTIAAVIYFFWRPLPTSFFHSL